VKSGEGSQSLWLAAARRFIRYPSAVIASVYILAVCLAAILAPELAPDNASQIVGSGFEPPSVHHWLGTDGTGRDEFSRLLFGARISMTVGVVVVVAAIVIACPIGLLSGYIGDIFGDRQRS
jgi:peptide/nickel transport system permease protein